MGNADIIREHYAASDRGDLDGMLAPFAPDVRWTEAAGFPYAGTYIGPDAVAANVFRRIQEDWDDYTVAIDEVIDAGDVVVGIGTYSGTFRRTGRSSRRAGRPCLAPDRRRGRRIRADHRHRAGGSRPARLSPAPPAAPPAPHHPNTAAPHTQHHPEHERQESHEQASIRHRGTHRRGSPRPSPAAPVETADPAEAKAKAPRSWSGPSTRSVDRRRSPKPRQAAAAVFDAFNDAGGLDGRQDRLTRPWTTRVTRRRPRRRPGSWWAATAPWPWSAPRV